MKSVYFYAALLLLAASAGAGHHEAPEGATMSAEEQAVMQAMQAASAPGDPHAHLARSVGSYSAAMQFWMGPDTEPLDSTMTVEREMDLGGRVLVERWKGQVMGAPFEGIGRSGYDNVTKRYWSTWTDNMSTGVLVMYGQWDDEKNSIEYTGKSTNPVNGKSYSMRSVAMYPAEGKEKMMMYEDHGQGEYQSMAFVLTRQ